MLQMFLAASASSQFSLATLSVLQPDDFEKYRAKSIKKKQRGLKAVLIGSSLLGIGMAMAGKLIPLIA